MQLRKVRQDTEFAIIENQNDKEGGVVCEIALQYKRD